MVNHLSVLEFLHSMDARVTLDVRSPGEFAHGHIPNAINFPLFSDEERSQVGTLYKQVGKEEALELGLEIVGPKMAGFVKEAKRLASNKQLAVHCWRGGQRSGSMAWLLRTAGFDVVTLSGGYKSYRQFVLEAFLTPTLPLIVIGGSTGSGKTKVLKAVARAGAQIIDLEQIAHHKGSAFGTIGEPPQPTVEQFENNLHHAISNADPSKPVWIENESRSIGRVYIPDGFWNNMKSCPLFNITIPESARISNLLEDYVLEDKEALIVSFEKISRKLGGLQLKNALDALENNDFEAAAKVALGYYDKTYQHCLDTSVSPDIRYFDFDSGDADAIASVLIAASQNNNKQILP